MISRSSEEMEREASRERAGRGSRPRPPGEEESGPVPVEETAGSIPSPEGPGPDEEEAAPALEGQELRSCIEALLFAAPGPLPRRRLRAILPEITRRTLDEALLELEGELLSSRRGYTLKEDAAGLRLLTRPEFGPFVARLRGERRRMRLSPAAFEALAVIAYRQPVRRADLEAIRGVQCGSILKNLTEWNLVRVVGQEESPGRPLLYGTTQGFLEELGLTTLSDLPEPEQFLELGSAAGLARLDEVLDTPRGSREEDTAPEEDAAGGAEGDAEREGAGEDPPPEAPVGEKEGPGRGPPVGNDGPE